MPSKALPLSCGISISGGKEKKEKKKTSSAAQVAVYRTWNKPPKVIISEDIRAGVSGCSGTDASQAVT